MWNVFYSKLHRLWFGLESLSRSRSAFLSLFTTIQLDSQAVASASDLTLIIYHHPRLIENIKRQDYVSTNDNPLFMLMQLFILTSFFCISSSSNFSNSVVAASNRENESRDWLRLNWFKLLSFKMKLLCEATCRSFDHKNSLWNVKLDQFRKANKMNFHNNFSFFNGRENCRVMMSDSSDWNQMLVTPQSVADDAHFCSASILIQLRLMNETPARLEPNWNGALWKYFLDAYTWKKLIKFTSSANKSIQFCYQKVSLSEINWENFYDVFALSTISTLYTGRCQVETCFGVRGRSPALRCYVKKTPKVELCFLLWLGLSS